MQETAAFFVVLGVAGMLPNPFDLAISFVVFLGLVARDRTTWGRHVAVFAFMLSRTWPMWINDPFAVYELCIFLIGFGAFQTRLVEKASVPYIKELLEVTYAVLLLLPLHSAPHPLASLAFCICACAEWFASSSTRPDAIVRYCVWLLCMRRASLLSFCGMAYSAWLVRRHLLLSTAARRSAAPSTPSLGATSSLNASLNASLTTHSARPPRAPKSTQAIHSARVPSEYIRRSVPNRTSTHTPDIELGSDSHPAIDSDDI